MSYRKICAWCKADLGPVGPEFTGDTHGICGTCQTNMLKQIQPVAGNGWGGKHGDEMDKHPVNLYKARFTSDACCGFTINPAWSSEPGAAKLLHCTQPATTRLTVVDSGEVEIKACCENHAAQLRAMARAGRIEIISDENGKR